MSHTDSNMSASTASYASMLGGMWAPEGSEINERLKRLHELEQMRKEREAKQHGLLNSKGAGSTSGVGIVRSSRMNSSDPDTGSTTGIGLRRTLSMRENSDGYGGARPKMGGTSGSASDDGGFGGQTIFSEIKASLLGPRKPLRGEYTSRSRLGSSDSDSSTTDSSYSRSYTRPTTTDRSYTRSYSNPQEDGGSLFSGITSSVLGDKTHYQRQPYRSRITEEPCEQSGQEYDQYGNSYSSYQGSDNHSENTDEDHGEEPLHFINRLKNGKGTDVINEGQQFHSIPAVPPLNFKQTEDGGNHDDLPELVPATEDIVSVAQEISSTFGNQSPSKSPNKSTSGDVEPVNQNESVVYEIHEVNYDSSGDEEGKTLKVRESFYNVRPSEWGIVGKTPGRLDQMQEYFTGESVGEDPNISRELNGEKVKAELERSISEPKNERKRVSDRSSGRKTPTKFKKTLKKDSPGNRSKSPLERLKKSSESENDSVPTSESEVESNGMRKPTARRKIGLNQNASTPKTEEQNGMSLSDKLAKLESLTQEKQRKQSVGENDVKKAVPSYMAGTSSSERKKSRAKEQSPGPGRDLRRDVREIRQFVRENSEPNTPISSPVKTFMESISPKLEDISTKDTSVQTEFVLDFPDINYVCKHCGKSSFEEVKSPLTEDNVKTIENKKEINPSDKMDMPNDKKFSSKDSVKSVGESSSKSEKIHRYKPKAAAGTQSYMKGTTASRLKSTAQTSDAKGRKGSAPEIIHRAEQESVKASTSLRGNVSDKLKAFEKANKGEKTRPALSLFRGKSVEREKPEISEKPKLSKSKSVDQVSVLASETASQPLEKDNIQSDKSNNVESTPAEVSVVPPSPGEKQTRTQLIQKMSTPRSDKPPVEKLDLSTLVAPLSPRSPRSPVRKPLLASPRSRESEISPRSVTSEQNTEKEAGQSEAFTTLDDNPFIKNDVRRRNSFKGRDKEESIWEKAGHQSRESSLTRSHSSTEADKVRPGSVSSQKHHNTSAGEKSSTSELTWSDSGSMGSLRGSKSSLHGSDTSLNKDGISDTRKPRSQSGSSTNSQTKASHRHPVSGAIETDIDAAFSEQYQDSNIIIKGDEHNEESVNKAHLEFAKKACEMLESDKEGIPAQVNGHDHELVKTKADNCHVNGLDSNTGQTNGLHDSKNSSVEVSTQGSRKQKGRKGLFKGKFSKK